MELQCKGKACLEHAQVRREGDRGRRVKHDRNSDSVKYVFCHKEQAKNRDGVMGWLERKANPEKVFYLITQYYTVFTHLQKQSSEKGAMMMPE